MKVFWLEAGQNSECEKVLNLGFAMPTVIAFREGVDYFVKMNSDYSARNINQFIDQVELAGLENVGKTLPYGGITLNATQ